MAAGLAQSLCAGLASSLGGSSFFYPPSLHGLCLRPSQIQGAVGLGFCRVRGSETGQRGEVGGPINLMRLWGACVCPCPRRGPTLGLWLGKQMAAMWACVVPPARDLHRTEGGERVTWTLVSPEAQCGWDFDLVFSCLAPPRPLTRSHWVTARFSLSICRELVLRLPCLNSHASGPLTFSPRSFSN